MKSGTLRRGLIAGAVAIGTAFAGLSGAVAQRSAEDIERVRDSWIFVFHDSVTAAEAPGRAQAAIASANGRGGHVYTNAVRGFSASMPADAAARLAANNPNIAYYEPDQVVWAAPPPPGKGPGGGGDDGGGGTDPA